MGKKAARAAALLAVIGTGAPATSVAAAKRDSHLSLTRVRLYETGVGYFERRGRVSGEATHLSLPASHLDDALKSLVILGDGRGGAQIAGVSFPSSVGQGMARAMAGLPPVDAEVPIDHQTLLRSMIGLSVEARTPGERIRGQVMEVLGPFARPAPRGHADEEDADPASPAPPLYAVLLVTESGRVRRISTDDLLDIGPRESGQVQRIQAAATALSDNAARRAQSLRVEVARPGSIALGYVSETPVWRTSYRVVLPDAGDEATLQAWALVHNDTDESWEDVMLEFVNGEPTSFLFPLAAPRYERRELREPERPLSTVPQLARHTVDSIYGDLEGTEIGESYGVGGLGLVGTGRGGGGSGEGVIGLGTTGTVGHGGGSGSAGDYGDLAEFSQAEVEPSGALFSYKPVNPIDLPAHSSALVPLVQSSVTGETIVWVPDHASQGSTAARIVNVTAQTLPAGTIAFFNRGGFAGEAQLPRLKPTERAFLTYGTELDVEVSRRTGEVSETTVEVVFRHDSLYERRKLKAKVQVDVENRDAADKQVYVGLPYNRNASIEGAPELDYDHGSGRALMVVTVPARDTASHALDVTTGNTVRHERGAMDGKLLGRLASLASLPRETREVLGRALEIRNEIEGAQKRRTTLASRIERETVNLDRLRESVSAVGESRAADRSARQLARQLVETERALIRFQARRDELETQIQSLEGQLDTTLGELAG